MTRGEHPGRDRDRTRERDHGRLSTQRDLRYRAMSWLTPDLPEVPSPCQPPRATPLDNTGDPLTTWPWVLCVSVPHCAWLLGGRLHLLAEGVDVHRRPVLDQSAVAEPEDVDELEFHAVPRRRQ